VLARLALQSDIAAQLLRSVPAEMRKLVSEQLGEVAAWNGGSVAAPAALVFVWLASGGVHAVFELLEVKAGCSRPWWKKRLLAMATCIALAVGTAVVAAVSIGMSRVTLLLRGIIPFEAGATETTVESAALRLVIGFGAALVLVAGLYWVGAPKVSRVKRHLWPGAFLAVALQSALGYGYVFYLAKSGSGSAYQAGLSIIGVTMMALYLFGIALLVGAQLNHRLGHPKLRAAEGPPL